MTQGVFDLDLLGIEQDSSLGDCAGWSFAIAAYLVVIDLVKAVLVMSIACGLGCATRFLF